jgi:hypothetical protein
MENSKHQFFWKGIDLEAFRQVMDKPADEAVQAVFDSTSMDHLRTLLVGLAQNDSLVSDQLPKPMSDFIKSELAFSFSEEDIKLFNQTHEVWKEKGIKFVFILFFRALPYTYMAEKPANVLKMTKLLIEQPERRIFETAQFVFDVMDKNWWEPDKRGILTALKVRIMHSAMRHIILNNKDGKKWNEDWGNPISQEDLVATNQVFSLEFFKGMSMLGDTLNSEEQKAWFHTWKIIGKIMGIKDELICKDVEEAWKLQHTVYDHLFNDQTEAGIPLTKALVETMHHFHLPVKLTLFMMRRMLADEQYPDCFERMLGPSYKELYPDFFVRPQTDQEKKDHKKRLHQDFHHDLKEFHATLRQEMGNYQKSKPKQGYITRLLDWVFKIFGRIEKRSNLIDTHVGILHEIMDQVGIDGLIDEFDELVEEEIVTKSMSAVGGIMVSILSVHFREGKQSGFRIPADLREHWSLT